MYDGPQKISKKVIPLLIFRWTWQVLIVLLISLVPTIIQLRDVNLVLPIPLIVIGVLLLFFIVITLFAFIYYKRFTWELTSNELHIYKGIIVRNRLHVPYSRMHTADINATLFERLLGVVTLKLDTAGGSHRDADAKIPGIEAVVAEQIKNEIFRRKAVAEGGGNAAYQASLSANLDAVGNQFSADVGTYFDHNVPLGQFASDAQGTVYRLSVKELVLAGITSSSAFVMILLFVAMGVQGLGIVMGMMQSYGTVESYVQRGLDAFAQLPVGLIILLVLVVILIAFGFAILGKLISLWGFTVRRNGKNIEVHRGLLTKVSTVVSVDRIQAIRVKQGAIRRIFGFSEIMLEKVAMQMQNSEGKQQIASNIIHPFIRKKHVDEFICTILPEYAGAPEEATLETLSGAALRRSFFRYARWTFCFIVIPLILVPSLLARVLSEQYGSLWWETYSWIFAVVIAVGFFLTGFLMITALFAWKGRAIGFDEKFLVMRSGAYGRRFVYFPRRKIQYAQMQQNPFQRYTHLATVSVFSASPMLRKVSTIDVRLPFAEAFLDWVERYSQTIKR
ncbi:MAG: PH domain-containing protein [Clostridiales Family XIII bacterium]|nr:PH domain-containing protein [Clostridiales Family XIII bacterium]